MTSWNLNRLLSAQIVDAKSIKYVFFILSQFGESKLLLDNNHLCINNTPFSDLNATVVIKAGEHQGKKIATPPNAFKQQDWAPTLKQESITFYAKKKLMPVMFT